MAIQTIMNQVCVRIRHIPTKVLCVLMVGLQAFFIDAILVNYLGNGPDSRGEYCNSCYWFIIGDVVVGVLFIVTFIVTFKHLSYIKANKRLHKYHLSRGLPLACGTWFLYSIYLAARITVIFKTAIDDSLEEDQFYGPQFLKTGISLTAVVFILFITSHHHAEESPAERHYISSLTTGVTFDILDTVDFLNILIVTETGVILTYPVENVIVTIAFINIMKPTFAFLVLVLNHVGATKLSKELTVVNAFLSIFIINTPFMVIRMYLWHTLKQDVSVFLIKNFIMIFIGVYEIAANVMEKAVKDAVDHPYAIEMNLETDMALPHRPSDVQREESEPKA